MAEDEEANNGTAEDDIPISSEAAKAAQADADALIGLLESNQQQAMALQESTVDDELNFDDTDEFKVIPDVEMPSLLESRYKTLQASHALEQAAEDNGDWKRVAPWEELEDEDDEVADDEPKPFVAQIVADPMEPTKNEQKPQLVEEEDDDDDEDAPIPFITLPTSSLLPLSENNETIKKFLKNEDVSEFVMQSSVPAYKSPWHALELSSSAEVKRQQHEHQTATTVLLAATEHLLTALRAEERYARPDRFVSEFVQTSLTTGKGKKKKTVTVMDTSLVHPAVTELCKLQWRAQQEQLRLYGVADENDKVISAELVSDLLEPYCVVIRARDCSATVTRAALEALQSILSSGLLELLEATGASEDTKKENEDNNANGNTKAFDSSSLWNRVAHAVMHCTFEETPLKGVSIKNRKAAAAVAALTPPEDEQTVLALLDVVVLLVQHAMNSTSAPMLDSATIVRLVDTCIHVSHYAPNASLLLKAAAAQASNKVVHAVYCSCEAAEEWRRRLWRRLVQLLEDANEADVGKEEAEDDDENDENDGDNNNEEIQEVVVIKVEEDNPTVMHALFLLNTSLVANPCVSTNHSDQELQSITAALVRTAVRWPTSVKIQTQALNILHHVGQCQANRPYSKVSLEVVWTRGPLRVLATSLASSTTATGSSIKSMIDPNLLEVTMDSLLPYAHDPYSLFLNYECDVGCSNLYHHLVTSFGFVAVPATEHDDFGGVGTDIGTGRRRMRLLRPKRSSSNNESGTLGANSESGSTTTSHSLRLRTGITSSRVPVTHVQRVAMRGLLAVLQAISTTMLTQASSPDTSSKLHEQERQVLETCMKSRDRKKSLIQVAQAFNNLSGDAWLKHAVELGVITDKDDVDQVASLLYTASAMFDSSKVGLYLGKGPEDKYPFHAKVRSAFCAKYDFSKKSFAGALRLFLSKFRLPGEAQCIDRLMEAFSKEVFLRQQQTSNEEEEEKDPNDNTVTKESKPERSLFHDADAVYVLAFSTILLNTDLHNPTLAKKNRMTQEQFLRNNRGINNGEDLPVSFLTELYAQIKHNEIQVRPELGELLHTYQKKSTEDPWDSVLSKMAEVAPGTPKLSRSVLSADWSFPTAPIFHTAFSPVLNACAHILRHSVEDAWVIRALDGLKLLGNITIRFESDCNPDRLETNDDSSVLLGSLDSTTQYFPRILQVLLSLGSDYVLTMSKTTSKKEKKILDPKLMPLSLLSCSKARVPRMDGAARHRGLLALDEGLQLARRYLDIKSNLEKTKEKEQADKEKGQVSDQTTAPTQDETKEDQPNVLDSEVALVWSEIVSCVCSLRDAGALPGALAELDDFADSNGTILPLSKFALTAQSRMQEFYTSKAAEETQEDTSVNNGWFRNLFRKRSKEDIERERRSRNSKKPATGKSPVADTLWNVSKSANLERLLLSMEPHIAIPVLLSRLDSFPFKRDPVGEHHAIYALELATRSLLAHREDSVRLFGYFLNTFEAILSEVSENKVPAPFCIERIVVTVLRCGIHMYDMPEVSNEGRCVGFALRQ